MSQKKLKKLRKLENQILVKEIDLEPVKGIRQILKENWKFLALLCLGVFILYFNSLRGDFVSDDYATIPNNIDIMSFKNAISGGSIGGIINWLLAITFGIVSPIHFHVFSLFTYLFTILVVFIFVSVLFDIKTSKITAILFAVLPLHVEAVSWIAGRPYLLNAFFVLITLSVGILYSKTENKKYLYSFFVLLLISFFAERTRFAVLPLLVFLYWFSFENKIKKKINFGKIFLVMGILFLIMVFILWSPLMTRISNVNSGYNGSGGIFYNPFFQYPTAIAKYLQLIFAPTDLTLYHTMYIIPVWLNWAILMTYLSAVGYFFFKDKKIFFALSFIFIAASLSMLPVKISWLVAERYMFLGSLGFCLFLALCFEKLRKKNMYIAVVLFACLLSFYFIKTYLRNIDWQTNHNLWVSTCQVSPNSHNAWNNIGDDYDKLAQLETTDEGKLNQYFNSVKGFTQSTVVKPDYADAFHNRANIFYKTGRLDLARDSYETALKFSPGLFQTYFSLIQIDLTEKRYDLAMDHLNKLNKIKPNDLQVYYITAIVYANMGQKDQAIQILEQIIKVVPSFKEASNLLSQLKK